MQVSSGTQKVSFTFHLWHKSFVLDDMKLAELSSSNFEWNGVAFLGGSKHTLTLLLSYIFSGHQDPQNLCLWIIDHCCVLQSSVFYTVQERCDDYVKRQLMKISAKNHLDWRYVRNTQTRGHFLFEHSLLCCRLAQLIQLTDNVKVARSNPMRVLYQRYFWETFGLGEGRSLKLE